MNRPSQKTEGEKNRGDGFPERVFDRLYQDYADAVYGYACYLTRNRTEADDLFQETWLRVARSRPEAFDPRSAKSWIFTIATNLYRDSLRKLRVRKLFLLKARPPESLEQTVNADISRDLARALAALPERQRRVFLLKEIGGLPQAEISDILGIPLGTVKSLMFRAVRQLRRELTEYRPKTLVGRGSYAL